MKIKEIAKIEPEQQKIQKRRVFKILRKVGKTIRKEVIEKKKEGLSGVLFQLPEGRINEISLNIREDRKPAWLKDFKKG